MTTSIVHIPRSTSCTRLLVAVVCVAGIAVGCDRTSRREAHSAVPPAHGQVVCTVEDATLACLALLQSVDAETRNVTREVEWISSNPDVALVQKGVVTGVAAGAAEIRARLSSRDEVPFSGVTVLVQRDHVELATSIEGALRDVNNVAVAGVVVTLVADDGTGSPTSVPSDANGEFRLFPVSAGRYRVIAEKPGFRASHAIVEVPTAHPVTLVLLAEPRDRTRRRASSGNE